MTKAPPKVTSDDPFIEWLMQPREREFVPDGSVPFWELREQLGEAMFPDQWTGDECRTHIGEYGRQFRSKIEAEAFLARSRAIEAKRYELADLPLPNDSRSTNQYDDFWETGFVRLPNTSPSPLTPEQEVEIDRELMPITKEALSVKIRRDKVETALQQEFWGGKRSAFFISPLDGQRKSILQNVWAAKGTHMHQTGRFQVDEEESALILIERKEADEIIDAYRFRNGAPSSSASLASAETKCREWLKSLDPIKDIPKNRDELKLEAQKRFPGLSERAFFRTWKDEAPKAWKKPGKRSMRKTQ